MQGRHGWPAGAEVNSLRAEKLVFVTAEKNVRWGEFTEMPEQVWPEADVVSDAGRLSTRHAGVRAPLDVSG